MNKDILISIAVYSVLFLGLGCERTAESTQSAGPNEAKSVREGAETGGAGAAERSSSTVEVALGSFPDAPHFAAIGTAGAAMEDVFHDPLSPLPRVARERLLQIRNDPDPEALVRDAHYWVSNENAHYVYYPHIKDAGGSLVGVGTDQLYLMAGWARSSLLIPLDFDRAITRLHDVYGILFKEAETPEEFRGMWLDRNKEETIALIKERYEGDKLDQVLNAYETANLTVTWRFSNVIDAYEPLDVPTFITDQEQYDFVRSLWLNDRVFPVTGDLTGDRTMMDVADTLRSLGEDLRLLYVSNAEIYFPVTPEWRRNVIIQPWSQDSRVLRTRQVSYLGLAVEKDYHYNIQPGINLAQFCAFARGVKDIGDLFYYRDDTDVQGLSFIKGEVLVNSNPPEVAERADGVKFDLPPMPPEDLRR